MRCPANKDLVVDFDYCKSFSNGKGCKYFDTGLCLYDCYDENYGDDGE